MENPFPSVDDIVASLGGEEGTGENAGSGNPAEAVEGAAKEIESAGAEGNVNPAEDGKDNAKPTVEAKKPNEMIPRSRFNEINAKRKAAEARIAELEAKLNGQGQRYQELENLDRKLSEAAQRDPSFKATIHKALFDNAEEHSDLVEQAVAEMQSNGEVNPALIQAIKRLEDNQKRIQHELLQRQQNEMRQLSVEKHFQKEKGEADAFFARAENKVFDGNAQFFNAAVDIAASRGVPMGQALMEVKAIWQNAAKQAQDALKKQYSVQNGSKAKDAAAAPAGPAGTTKAKPPQFGTEEYIRWVEEQAEKGVFG